MSSKTRRSTTLTLSVLVVGVALVAYAFMPVSTFAAKPESERIALMSEQNVGGDQAGNSTITNDTASIIGQTPDQQQQQTPDNNESQQQQQTPDNNESQQQQQTPDNNENPIATNTTVSNATSPFENKTASTHAGFSDNNTDSSENNAVPDSNSARGFNNGSNQDKTITSDNTNNNGNSSDHNLKDLNNVNNDNNNQVGGDNSAIPEKKLYDDSKNIQGPKYYKYKHDVNGGQGDRNDGRVGEYYNSHQKKFFRYKHDFNYYDNVRIIIHHFYFRDFAGADFFVHFDYEYHHNGQVQIFFDHPFADHSYDKEGRFYYDDEGNEFQCDQYFQGSVYYEFDHAFYKCEDLMTRGDFEGGY
jgi:hypothetical protein